MKKKVNFLFALATVGLMWTGCSNESEELIPSPNPGEGEKSFISLTIENKATTRAPEPGNDATETPEGAEATVTAADGLKVFVFNSNGTLDTAAPNGKVNLAESGGKYVSDGFTVTAGAKYFFVFANDGANKIVPPTAAMTMTEFMEKTVAVALDANAFPTELTNAGSKFLLGSLWGETTTAPAGGTDATPKHVALTIGRLTSKINLAAVDYTEKDGDLKGEFKDARYRLGTIPKKINTVGVHLGNALPTAANGVVVKSAVHSTAAWSSTDVANYYPYNTGTLTSAIGDWPAAKALGETFYAVENTSGNEVDMQRFGNTTFIQFETIYTPDADEIFDPATLTKYTPALTNNTFWRVRVKAASTNPAAGKWIIVGVDPTTLTLHADIETMTEYPQYTGGKNYHKFAIFDRKEDGNEVCKNRVLRNHYYEFKVTKFNGLGEPTDKVDPNEPIPNKTTVDVTVTVKDWDKITGETEV